MFRRTKKGRGRGGGHFGSIRHISLFLRFLEKKEEKGNKRAEGNLTGEKTRSTIHGEKRGN